MLERTAFRLFSAPYRYIQGAGALVELAPLVAGFGKRPFIVADAATTSALRERVEHLLGGAVSAVVFGACGERCTAAGIDHLTNAARELSADVIIGLGARSAIDTAKGMQIAVGLPLITVPTAPACHAPVSRSVEVQAEGDRFAETRMMVSNPDVVVVDTAVIAASPSRSFIAGIGDALAGKFEVERHAAAGAPNILGCRSPLLAVAAAEEAHRTMRRDATTALAAIVRRVPDDSLERVTEAVILLSGIGFEHGGPSLAHALAARLAASPACRTILHGELVAFALLVQRVVDGASLEELQDLIAFYRTLGLPTRLREIGLVGETADVIESIAAQTCREYVPPINNNELAAAIMRADRVASG